MHKKETLNSIFTGESTLVDPEILRAPSLFLSSDGHDVLSLFAFFWFIVGYEIVGFVAC